MEEIKSEGRIECPMDEIDKFIKPLLENDYDVHIFFDGMNCGIDYCQKDHSLGYNRFMVVKPEEEAFLLESRELGEGLDNDEDDDYDMSIDYDRIVNDVIRLETLFFKGLLTTSEYEGHLARLKRGG